MNHFTLSSLDADAIARVPAHIDYVHIEGAQLAPMPPTLSALPKVKGIQFHRCAIAGFDPSSRNIGTSNVEMLFEYCELDEDALFEFLLEHGPGTWRVNIQRGDPPAVQARRKKRFQLLHEIGNDGAGDKAYRTKCLSLVQRAAKAVVVPNTLPAVAGRDELALLTHSKKTVRELALVYLEGALPDALVAGQPPTAFFVVGKPIYLELGAIRESLAARGVAIVNDVRKASHALVLAEPKDKLQPAIAAGLPVVLEKHLKDWLARATDSPESTARLTTADSRSVEELLQSPDHANVLLGLKLARACDLDRARLPTMLALAFFHTEKKVREAAKAFLVERGPRDVVERLQGDKRNYVAMSDEAKFVKLARELQKSIGLDPAAFMDRVILLAAQREQYWSTRDLLQAAWTFDVTGSFLRHVRNMKWVSIWKMKGALPEGLQHLTGMENLQTTYGMLSSAKNMNVLAALPSLVRLDVATGTKLSSFEVLAPLAQSGLRHLVASHVEVDDKSLSPLHAFTQLESLHLDLWDASRVDEQCPEADVAALRAALPDCKVTTS